VKTCGKSARLLLVTTDGDKPCGLKCHVHPGSVSGFGIARFYDGALALSVGRGGQNR